MSHIEYDTGRPLRLQPAEEARFIAYITDRFQDVSPVSRKQFWRSVLEIFVKDFLILDMAARQTSSESAPTRYHPSTRGFPHDKFKINRKDSCSNSGTVHQGYSNETLFEC
jgi:hypothetical protein